ncbi:MAG: hypothetical protein PHS41_06685 [Victivallaceae bacterium]|nr:hypothetical protein [Victivallaceae bacterium]
MLQKIPQEDAARFLAVPSTKDGADNNPTDGFRMDRERNAMADLSVATRRVTTEKPPFQAFSEPPEDAARFLAVPSTKTRVRNIHAQAALVNGGLRLFPGVRKIGTAKTRAVSSDGTFVNPAGKEGRTVFLFLCRLAVSAQKQYTI